jgi:hypothetical protein
LPLSLLERDSYTGHAQRVPMVHKLLNYCQIIPQSGQRLNFLLLKAKLSLAFDLSWSLVQLTGM